MDTQIKLIVKTEPYNKYCQPKEEIISIDISNEKDLIKTDTIFEIKEYDKVTLQFISDDTDMYMKLESYLNNIDDTMSILRNGESIQLSPGGDNDNMLVPGIYSIQICSKYKLYEWYYKIIPNSLQWDKINNIKEYLENTIKGLSQNIYLQKKSSKQGYVDSNKNIEKYLYLIEIQEKLLNNINQIINNPIKDIKKEYTIKDYSSKQDSKSQRWMNKKGIRYKINITDSDKFFEKHSYISNENIENIIIKRIIEYIQNILVEAEYEYINISNIIKNKKKDTDKLIEENRLIYRKALSLPNTTEINKIRQNKINNLYKEQEINKNKLNITYDNLSKLKIYKGRLNFFLNETWLRDIEVKYTTKEVTSRIMKNNLYSDIYIEYNKLKNSNSEGGLDVTFPYKKTSKLFEIYCFLLTKDIFEELGFIWTNGWLKSRDLNELYNGDLLSDESITLEKDEYKIVISYDKYIGIPEELKEVELSQPSTKPDNQHRRPDILVSLYRGSRLLGCEVVEVKYRRKCNLYNKSEIDTDVCKQLSSYTGFDYYDASKGRVIRERPVYKVLTLYPKQDELGQYKHNVYDIEFIPIMPTSEEDKKYYGYENLKSELIEFLNEFIDK